MVIDIHACEHADKIGRHLLRLDDAALAQLQEAFLEFERRTGRHIDPYGRTPFPPGTLAPLLDVFAQLPWRRCPAASELAGVLRRCHEEGQGVLFDGE